MVCIGKPYKRQKEERDMIMEIISIFLWVVLLGAYVDSGFELYRLIMLLDAPSLIIILVFTVPVLFKSGVWKDFKRAWRLLKKDYTCHLSELRRTLDVVEMMQKQVIYAGIVCMLLSFINVLCCLSDLRSLGPNIAVAVLVMLYALFLEMLLLPLQLEVKRRIIDYMEVDTDAESGKEDEIIGRLTEKTEETGALKEDGQI